MWKNANRAAHCPCAIGFDDLSAGAGAADAHAPNGEVRTGDSVESLDRSEEQAAVFEYPAEVYLRDGRREFEQEDVQGEHTLDVYLDGKLSMRIVCSPFDLQELVLGRLFTEGVIESADDVEFMYLCEHATIIRVLLREKRDLRPVSAPIIPSCCTGNKVFEALETVGQGMEPVTPVPWESAWIFRLADLFSGDTPMHRRTFGAHSCYLAIGDSVLYTCEDLGRHNAFDKVIGCALRNHDDLSRAIIYTSGRIPVDMVTKAIRAGIPILVSKAVPTDLTIELAREFDLTLICAARPDSMKVYNDPRWDGVPSTVGEWKVPRLFDAPAAPDDKPAS